MTHNGENRTYSLDSADDLLSNIGITLSYLWYAADFCADVSVLEIYRPPRRIEPHLKLSFVGLQVKPRKGTLRTKSPPTAHLGGYLVKKKEGKKKRAGIQK